MTYPGSAGQGLTITMSKNSLQYSCKRYVLNTDILLYKLFKEDLDLRRNTEGQYC